MDVNPYESPRESADQAGFNWERLSSMGLWTAVPSFAMLVVFPAIAFLSKDHPLLVFVSTYGFVLSLVGFLIGGVTAMVGWIGWEVSRLWSRDE